MDEFCWPGVSMTMTLAVKLSMMSFFLACEGAGASNAVMSSAAAVTVAKLLTRFLEISVIWISLRLVWKAAGVCWFLALQHSYPSSTQRKQQELRPPSDEQTGG
jgi:hypothetical protein